MPSIESIFLKIYCLEACVCALLTLEILQAGAVKGLNIHCLPEQQNVILHTSSYTCVDLHNTHVTQHSLSKLIYCMHCPTL